MSADEEWFDDFEDSQNGSRSEGTPYLSDSDAGGSDGDTPLQGEPGVASFTPKSEPYTVIRRPSLKSIQQGALDQVKGILGGTTSTARALLTHFSWDAESLLSTLAERGQEHVYKRAGVLSQTEEEEAAPPAGSRSALHAPIAPVCGVCLCEVSADEVEAMSCGHAFCRVCWKQHLHIGVQEGLSRRLRCMAAGCGVVCDENKVRDLLQDEPGVLDKYEQTLLESYVDDNRRVKWCPSVPHCGHAVQVTSDPHCDVDCACGHRFCFSCCEPPHSPATCTMMLNWMQRYRDGSETASWLTANTKPCPKCAKPVEKNGGCNLVVCRCGQAFCWLCARATGRSHTWSSIEGHSCGAYKEELESKATEAQRNLNRYLHYVTRYEAHLASLRLEQRARDALEGKIDKMIEAETSLSNYAWLQAALEQLFLARRVLAYSYIFAFYMFGGQMFADLPASAAVVNQALFEDKQGQLEVEVERLAKLVEETKPADIPAARLSTINLASTINTRICHLYAVIENDIATQLAASSLNIAPYRGQRSGLATGDSGGADSMMGQPLLAAGDDSGGGGGGTSGVGGSSQPDTSGQPATEVIDLIGDKSEVPPAAATGKGRAGSKRLKKG